VVTFPADLANFWWSFLVSGRGPHP